MKKYVIFAAVLTAAVLLSGCESGTADNLTESSAATSVFSEETESKTETTSSETSETETVTETETEVYVSETTEEVQTENSENFVVSPSGYVLDPQNVIPEEISFWYYTSEEVRKSGLAYLLTELPDGKTRVYGACPDEEPSKIIIEHNGIADEFEEFWSTRYGDIAYNDMSSCNFSDMDGDGENEVVLKRYAIGGTFCCIDFFSVYKMEDGHYKRYELDYERLADEYIKTDMDSDAKTVTVSVKGADKDFVYDSSETCPEGVKIVSYKNLVSYNIEGDSVKMSYLGLMGPNETGSALPIDDMIQIKFTVTLKDGEFVLSDPKINLQK